MAKSEQNQKEQKNHQAQELEQDQASGQTQTAEAAPSPADKLTEVADADSVKSADADNEKAAETSAPESKPAEAKSSSEEQPAPSEPSVAAAPAVETAAKQKLSKTAVVALIVALGGAGLSGWLYYQSQQLQQQNARLTGELQQISSNSQQMAGTAREQVGAARGQIEQLERQLREDRKSVDELQQRLTASVQQTTKQLNQLSGATRTDWKLAEVEYLLRLANQRILMERTATGALALLSSADKILQETDDVGIYPVRKALARDITALQAVPKLDTEGVFLKLSALDEQITKLRMIPVSEQHKLPSLIDQMTPEAAASWGNSLQQGWSTAMDKLGKLVVVQHHDEPVEPLLSPDQAYYLKQNLHLMLQQAQLALLQGEQASFDRSLSKAKEWAQTYFKTDDAVTQGLLTGLNELTSVQVAPTLPDISASLKELKAYLSMVHESNGGAA